MRQNAIVIASTIASNPASSPNPRLRGVGATWVTVPNQNVCSIRWTLIQRSTSTATPQPTAMPTASISTHSASRGNAVRGPVAPNAWRVAYAWLWPIARSITRLVMFTPASISRASAQKNTRSTTRWYCDTMFDASERTLKCSGCLLISPCRRIHALMRTSTAALAAACVTPGRKRAITVT